MVFTGWCLLLLTVTSFTKLCIKHRCDRPGDLLVSLRSGSSVRPTVECMFSTTGLVLMAKSIANMAAFYSKLFFYSHSRCIFFDAAVLPSALSAHRSQASYAAIRSCLVSHWLWLRSLTKIGLPHECTLFRRHHHHHHCHL